MQAGRFSYVAYGPAAQKTQQFFKAEFEKMEAAVNRLKDGRAKALVYTKLEEAYMWIGKAIRDEQVAAGGSSAELVERSDDTLKVKFHDETEGLSDSPAAPKVPGTEST